MANSPSLPKGTNLRLLLQECRCPADFLNRPDSVIEPIRKAVRESDLTPLTHVAHSFDEGGYTLAVILAESHVVIHTWPEHNHLVLAEISVCDFLRDNRARTLKLGETLAELYEPNQAIREVAGMIPRLSEKTVPGHGHYIEVDSLVDSRESAYQELVVADTPVFGRSLILDGVFQASEKDDYFYHEPLVHIPMLCHPSPRRILICGGGDGGAAREVLKHPSVEACVIVDIDREVVRVAEEHLRCIHKGSLDDGRVSVVIRDAAEYVREASGPFDVALLDSTDPVCAEELFTEDFYRNLKALLTPGGGIGLHVGAPLCDAEASRKAAHNVTAVFGPAHPYLHFVPSYGSLMGFLAAFEDERELIPPEEVGRRVAERGLDGLKIVAPETFHALFAIPPRLRNVFPAPAARAAR